MTCRWTRRRHLLKHAGAAGVLGLSGCMASLRDDSRSGRKGTDPSGRTVTDLSATGLGTAPISITATPTHAQITPERTAQFELTVRYEGSVRLEFGNNIPFSHPQRSEDPGVMLLLSSTEYERESEQTWIPAETIIAPPGNTIIEGSAGGGKVSREWAVWGDPDHVSRIEPGTYEFSSEIVVDGDPIRWTLSLTIATDTSEG